MGKAHAINIATLINSALEHIFVYADMCTHVTPVLLYKFEDHQMHLKQRAIKSNGNRLYEALEAPFGVLIPYPGDTVIKNVVLAPQF